jgi:hypothetical protein
VLGAVRTIWGATSPLDSLFFTHFLAAHERHRHLPGGPLNYHGTKAQATPLGATTDNGGLLPMSSKLASKA